jgi:hypothetical protein
MDIRNLPPRNLADDAGVFDAGMIFSAPPQIEFSNYAIRSALTA